MVLGISCFKARNLSKMNVAILRKNHLFGMLDGNDSCTYHITYTIWKSIICSSVKRQARCYYSISYTHVCCIDIEFSLRLRTYFLVSSAVFFSMLLPLKMDNKEEEQRSVKIMYALAWVIVNESGSGITGGR